MNPTNIEWVKNPDGSQGYTWNPLTGCLNNCSYCYARKLANTRLRAMYLANDNIAPIGTMIDGAAMRVKAEANPFHPRFWGDRLYLPFNDKPKGYFTCDMSDLFGIGIPVAWLEDIFRVIKYHPRDRFYLLTKQPQNLPKFSPFPSNCFVGVSATNQHQFDNAVKYLKEVEATVKYISFEPLLGEIKITPIFAHHVYNWVIIGAMTCGGADIAKLSYQYPELTPMPYGNRYTLQPKIEWVKEIVEACDKAGAKVFLKNNLNPLLRNSEGWTPALYVGAREPDGSKEYLRQEMPSKEGR